jgi:DNA topoisomerase-1
VQLGEAVDGEKPKRAGLPKGLVPDDVDLDKALGLLSLPRDVGLDPESGEMIVAGIGRFGSYVKLGKTYANLEPGDDVLNIGLNRAVTLIAEKKANPGKGRRFGADPGRSLGEHPDKGGPIVVKNGRYGAYVSHDGVNATLPADKTPDAITLEEAVSLIDARIAAGGGKKRKAAPKKADKKAEPKAKAEKTKTEKPKTEPKAKSPTAKAKAKPKAEAEAKPVARKAKAALRPRASAVKDKVPAERKRKAAT